MNPARREQATLVNERLARTQDSAAELPAWLQVCREGVIIKIKAAPQAHKTEIVGAEGEELKIKVSAPPVDGAANEALMTFLAKRLGVKKSALELKYGAATRHKSILVTGITPALTREKLACSCKKGIEL